MHSRVSNVFVKPYKKARIPKALREQVWITHMGRVFENKCKVTWCTNIINVFDFQSGHNIPESKGGKTNVGNLIPICSRCNNSMNCNYSIDDWNKQFANPPIPQTKRKWWSLFKLHW